jgi:chemosensory pili system protein ChpB (putative protein-glutamate methylesterase)
MVNAGLRIALLAKAGDARQQLQTALKDLGAELVCEGDPSEITPSNLLDLKPAVVVVGLEPSLEKSLQAFDDVLNNTSFEVVYDDAEVSGQLSGWDLNRWARHLAAKLTGSDIMPPIPAGAVGLDEAIQIAPGAPQTPEQAMADAKFEDYLSATSSMAVDVPASTDFSDALERDKGSLSVEEAKPALEIDFLDLEKAMQSPAPTAQKTPSLEVQVEPENDFIEPSASPELNSVDDLGAFAEFDFVGLDETAPPSTDTAVEDIQFEESFASANHNQAQDGQDGFEINLDDDSIFGPDPSLSAPQTAVVEEDFSTLADFEPSDEAVSFSNFQTSDDQDHVELVDDEVAALAAQLDANDAETALDEKAEVKDLDFSAFEQASSNPNTPSAQAAQTASQSSKPSFDFSSLELVDADAVIAPAAVQVAQHDSALIGKNNLQLEPTEEEKAAASAKAAGAVDQPVIAAFASAQIGDTKPVSETGAVLILAGMGGPDAVRQLLKALPADFKAPVLLYQHLEVGNHDRLVTQLAKISQLPVYLANVGQAAASGQVAVLPSGVGLDFVSDTLQFGHADSQKALVATMPPQHSAVVLLSGAALDAAQAAAYLQSNGGLAFAQDPNNCFEPAAASELIAKGGKTADIAEIGKMLVTHFTR